MTDRDTFAAAALTGLLFHNHEPPKPVLWWVEQAFDYADAMLRERAKTNHDAAPEAIAGTPGTGDTDHGASPEARASVDSVAPQPTTRGESDRNDKAAPRPSEGTGDTPDSPKPIKGGVSDRSKPINGPDPDSRVWETPVHTPATHATRGEGSEQREGTQEPVAWAVACDYGDYGVALFSDEASAQTEADRRALVGLRPGYVVVPLYRHPPCQDLSQKNLTLTDAEAETLRELRDEAAQYADEIGLCASEVRGRQRIIDGLLERLGGAT